MPCRAFLVDRDFREIFLRELISNANDALEKLRITSLKDKSLWDGTPLNVTIKAIAGEDGKSGKIIITGVCCPLTLLLWP
jgi:heat shock protein 90kDa beta